MKKITNAIVISCALLLSSCATQMVQKSPEEVKMMTTKQFETNKSLVFKSAISLLQSESYLVEDANESTGLIRASKRIENGKKANSARFKAKTSKISIYIEDINPELSEVKITLYEGNESVSYNYYGYFATSKNKDYSENMINSPEIYNNWFNNLRAEIERRKALTQ